MKMQKITKGQVNKVLASWKIRFPENKYSPNQMELLSREYFEDLQDEIPADIFDRVMSRTRKKCRWFPKVVDILDATKTIKERVRAEKRHSQLEETTEENNITAEERGANIKRLKILASITGGKITQAEGARQMEAVGSPEVFRGRLFKG